MAVFAATDYDIVINSVNLSDHIQSVELPVEVASLDTTNFDSSGWTETIGGLKSAKVSLNFMQDFASSEVEQTIYPLIGSTTSITVKPTSSAQSSTNPSYIATFLVSDWKPIAAKVGDLAVAQVSWPASGAVVRSTG